MIKDFRERANRSSIQTKLNSLLAEKDNLYLTIKQLYDLEVAFTKLGVINYLFKYPKLLQYLSLGLGIIMNIFILVGYNADEENSIEKNPLKNINLFFILDVGCKIEKLK